MAAGRRGRGHRDGHGPAGAIVQLLHDCWSAVGHDDFPALDPVVGGVSGAVLVAAAGRPAVTSLARRCRRTVLRRHHLTALRLTGTHDTRPIPTLWLPDDRPLAYSPG
ncbi:hypothetical protein AB0M83_10165 [Amycolatopsis sp. NPDC051106]|uniref:hypothetical protein n=1 Tax=unclassified Amycolatopsis TaxID=2618356 RepID=UPI00342D8FB6